jgi:hypothetical protein
MGSDTLIGRAYSFADAYARPLVRPREPGGSEPQAPVQPIENDAVASRTRNSLEIQAFGLRRSGNHALIAWIAQQYPKPIVFLNNARPFSDPFTNYLMGRVPNAVPHRRLNEEEAEQLRAMQKDLLLISYEDVLIRKLDRMEVLPQRRLWLGESGRTRRLLLMRDFYNWIASRVRLFENKGRPTDDILDRLDQQIRLWIMYAREFVGETQHLKSVETVYVRFDRWSDDQSYRSEVLEHLGITMRDNTRSIVPKAGGGSSFDGTRFSGNAETMDLLNRWSHLEAPECRSLLRLIAQRRDEIDEYNRQIFGMEYPFGITPP